MCSRLYDISPHKSYRQVVGSYGCGNSIYPLFEGNGKSVTDFSDRRMRPVMRGGQYLI